MANALRDASGEPLVRSTYISSAAPLPRDVPDLVAATPAGLMAATQEYGQFSGWHWTKTGIVTRCAHPAAHHMPAPMRCGLAPVLISVKDEALLTRGQFLKGSRTTVASDLFRSLSDALQDYVSLQQQMADFLQEAVCGAHEEQRAQS